MSDKNGDGKAKSKGSGEQKNTKGDSKDQEVKDDRVPAPPLVLISSSWLASVTSRIRARPIPWEGYARADLVSQDELKMIRSIDGKSAKEAERVLDERGEDYAFLYLRLLAKLSRTDTLQQVLVLVSDMLENRDDRTQLFFKASEKLKGDDKQAGRKKEQWPWHPLVKLLDVQDDFVQLKAAQFLALLLVSPQSSVSATLSKTPPNKITNRLLGFLSALINSTTASTSSQSAGAGATRPLPSQNAYADGNGADIAIQLAEAMLRTQQFRKAVWKDEMKKMGTAPKKEEKVVKKHDDDDDDDDENEDDGEGEEETETVKHGQTPGIIKGLVSILQSALVAPHGGVGNLAAQGQNRDRDQSSNSQRQQGSNNGGGSGSGSGSGSGNGNGSGGSSTPNAAISPQMQYQVIFCLWLLSFDEDTAEELNRKFGIVPILVDVARGAVKEKVIRVSIATLRNLLFKAPTQNAPVMLGSKLLPLVEVFLDRKWSDDDIVEDLKYLKEELSERLKGMSTYDEYLSELSSGKLSWENPAHELDDFWKANAQKLLDESTSSSSSEEASGTAQSEAANGEQQHDGEDDEGEEGADKGPNTGLKRLVTLLRRSQDALTLAVACHDIGKIVQFTDSGRRKLSDMGGKVEMLKLMSHEDPEVKFKALNTVGRLMSASWRS